jgi:branched-chain amino acid aminotransferase
MITYLNGEYVDHEDAKISVDDRGIMFGDAVFDIARTFDGKPFRLEEHLQRLRRSMNYAEFDGDGLLEEFREASLEVLARSEAEVVEAGDVFVEQIVTRGIANHGDDWAPSGPTRIVKLRKIPFSAFAPLYERGVDLQVSLLTLPYGGPVDPRVKSASRLANARADLKAERMRQAGAGYWCLMFNGDGSIAETNAANIALVANGWLVIPPREQALGGISQEALCELAESNGLEVKERRITFYDIADADEVFITATSFSLLRVVAVDGIPVGRSRSWFDRLLAAWIDLVAFDFVAQARERAGAALSDTPAPVPVP